MERVSRPRKRRITHPDYLAGLCAYEGCHVVAATRRVSAADVEGEGTLEIVVDLKGDEDRMQSALVCSVSGSETGCMPRPTGRGNYPTQWAFALHAKISLRGAPPRPT